MTICSFTDRLQFHQQRLVVQTVLCKTLTDQTYYTGDNGYVAGWVAG